MSGRDLKQEDRGKMTSGIGSPSCSDRGSLRKPRTAAAVALCLLVWTPGLATAQSNTGEAEEAAREAVADSASIKAQPADRPVQTGLGGPPPSESYLPKPVVEQDEEWTPLPPDAEWDAAFDVATDDWHRRTPWRYSTRYFFGLTRGLRKTGLSTLWRRVSTVVTGPSDVALLPFAAIAGLYGD